MKNDISIIRWKPLPAPAERYVLVRYRDGQDLGSCLAWSDETRQLRCAEGPSDHRLQMDVDAWAYLPYDPDLDC